MHWDRALRLGGCRTVVTAVVVTTLAVAASAVPAARLSAQTISSAANQIFGVGWPATAMSPITITAGSPTAGITQGNEIRIRIPTGFSMLWNTAITTATITGTAASKVSTTVSYENSGQILLIFVNVDFSAGQYITVSGLEFTSFTTVEAADNLELVLSGSASGATADLDDKTKAIATLTFTEVANQVFTVGDPGTAMSTVTITDGTATISAANDIRLRLPAALNMTWNTAVTTATIGGAAAGKVSTTVSYEDANQTLVLNVTADFAAGDQITVSGLEYGSFTAISAATALQLVISGPAGATIATSNRTKQIVQPTIVSAANQTFTVGDAAVTMSTITITDNATAPSINTTNDIRVRIPAGFNMTWNTAITTATIGGVSAARVSPIVSYEDAGQTLVITVISNFIASSQITVSGLQFNNFTAVSAAANLELVVAGAGGGTADTDLRTIQIVPELDLSSAANQVFPVSGASTAISAITITEDASPSINTTNDIRIRIPAGLNMTWNTADVTATITGADAFKVSTTVTYEDGGKVLRLNVTTTFAALDQIVVSGLSFNTFNGASPPANLEMVISGAFNGPTVATDDKTKTIVAPTLSSAANQVFAVGASATAMSAATVTDHASVATITATNDIRIRIPTGFNMTWNTAITTATITGSGASKVSTTVTYENSGQVLRLNVTTSFAVGDQIVVSGLQFNNFTAASAASGLQLVISGSFGGATVATDDKTKAISSSGAAVTPATTTASQLPSNGTNYTEVFTVQNTGGASDNYDLLITRSPGTRVTTISMTGTGVTQGANPDSARLTGVAASASVQVTVTYAVGNVAAGLTDALTLTARSTTDPSQTDSGLLDVTVVRPNMTVLRNRSPSGAQPPGTEITHTIDITNAGTTGAAVVVLVDSLAANSDFKLSSVVTNLPAGISVAVEYSNDGGTSWTYTPVSQACVAPAGFDGCVNRIRWRLLSNLSAIPPDNTGNVEFVSRIR